MTPNMTLSDLRVRPSAPGQDSDNLRERLFDPALETPVMTLSRSAVGANYRALQSALPRARIHYAVKPNNHPAVIEEVFRQGGTFDICSAGEIDLVRRTGIDMTSLVHSHPIKSVREFDRAVAAGVELFVVDNPEEIRKLDRYGDRRLKVMVRFRIRMKTSSVVNLQYKFGALPEDVLPLARMIEHGGHSFHGLCFHVGSQCTDPQSYVAAITTARDLIHALDMAGLDTRVLDIGGGFPVSYLEPVAPIDDFCRPIQRSLEQGIRPGIRVLCEPGRFIAATPVTLICSVIGKAERDGKVWYYLDDGLYSTFSGIVYDSCRYPVVTTREGAPKPSVLAGPTCDSFDVLYDDLMIPEHEVGDRLAFLSTGAYCAVSGSGFNALARADYVVVE